MQASKVEMEETKADEVEVKDLVSGEGLPEVQSPCQEQEDEVMQAVSDTDEGEEEPSKSELPAEVGSNSCDPSSVPLFIKKTCTHGSRTLVF